LRRPGRSCIAALAMSAVLQSAAREPATLDSAPVPATSHGQAVRDVRDAVSLWRLCWTLGWLDIKLRYRGSMLGPFWLTLSTAVMVAAMGGIYASLFKMNLRDYLPFLVLSLVLWNFLAALVGDACVGYTSAEGMIRSVRMPFTLYAARIVLRNVLIVMHNLLVVVAVFAIFGTWPGIGALLAVPGFALWLLDALALSVLLGGLCARFRDIPPIVASVLQMAFFVTPVIWKPEAAGAARQWLLPFNPFFAILEMVRAPLLGALPSVEAVLAALLYSIVLCATTWLLFVRMRGRIAFWV
jgi:lipopolysaccharide transport system permease protein